MSKNVHDKVKKRLGPKYIIIGLFVIGLNIYLLTAFINQSFFVKNEDKKELIKDDSGSKQSDLDMDEKDEEESNNDKITLSPTPQEVRKIGLNFEPLENPDVSIKEELFNLDAKFMNDDESKIGSWTYQVNGKIPTPCHSATVEPIVMESFPEKISIVVTVNPPSPDSGICIQVLQDYLFQGTINSVSRDASWEIKVN